MQDSGQFGSKSKKAAIWVSYFSMGEAGEVTKQSTSNSVLFCLETLQSAPEAASTPDICSRM